MTRSHATTGSTVTFTVNFKLDLKHVGMTKMANHGHLHFQMDGGKFDFPKYSGANGKLAAQLGIVGNYSPSIAPTITYKHLREGQAHSPSSSRTTTTRRSARRRHAFTVR